MKRWIACLLLVVTTILQACATPKTPGRSFYFVAMNQPSQDNENVLRKAFDKLERIRPAFAIVNGIKSNTESCSDELYTERKNLVADTRFPVIISLSNEDWVNCKNDRGESVAIERLIRLKEIFFENAYLPDDTPIQLTRQSLGNRFSNYPENAYWHMNSILFATIHMPADNNHYVAAAGRNNEFEDRTIANKNWLDRLFRMATRHHYKGIVLVSDGNPFTTGTQNERDAAKRDGFYEIRQKLNSLLSHYSGRVLFIYGHGTGAPTEIIWKGRLGTLGLRPEWTRIDINLHTPTLFRVEPVFRKASAHRKKQTR